MKKVKLFEQFISEKIEISPEAYQIHVNLSTGQDATQYFIDDNNIDGEKLAKYVIQHKNSAEKYVVRDMINGTQPNPKLLKKFIKESQDTEEPVNESNLIDALIPVAALITWWSPWLFAMWLAGTESGQDFQNSPSWKEQYKKWKSDREVTKIVARLEGDDDIKQFLLLPKAKQRGQWQKLIASKLTDSEMAYLKKINKGPFYTL